MAQRARPVQLVVGLGNPGPKYAATRHNAGFWFVDALAARFGGSFRPVARFFGELAEVRIAGADVRLLKPTTFMNRSGQAVAAVTHFYRIPAEQVLVVHDEIDLPPGNVRLKDGGGHGGHNGLRDLVAHLQGSDFVRLRVGVGHPGHRDDVIDYVLHRPAADEEREIRQSIERAMETVELVVGAELERAMNLLNRRAKAETESSTEIEDPPEPLAGRSRCGAQP